MAAKKLYGKDLKAYEDIDLEELLAKLTDAELEELHTDLIDPDDSMVPPSDRCRYKTDKVPTGPFDRKKLLEFLEKKGKEDKDWEEALPYVKQIRGKVWKPKEEDKVQINEDVRIETEWDEVLATATEAELVDLAAILGFYGMLNQVQYHQAFVEGSTQGETAGGFQGVAMYADFKAYEEDPPNTTDVEASLEQLKANDPKLKELNLNNLKKISIDTLIEIANALSTNTHLEKLHMSNTRATDKVARAIAAALEKNKMLKVLDMESNYISGQGILAILEAVNVRQVLEEFRISNQRPQVLGVRVEMTIAKLIRDNKSIVKFGIFLEIRCPRILVNEYLQRNHDNKRRGRVGEDIVLPPTDEMPFEIQRQFLIQGGPKKPEDESESEDEETDKKASQPATKTPEPAKKTPQPATKTPEPAKKTPQPAPKTPEPAKKFPGAKTPQPAPKTPEPVKKTPQPVTKTPQPAPKTPEPAKKTPGPAPKTPEPAKKTPGPAPKTPEPAKKTPGPAPKTPEPAKKSLFPGAKTPEPAKKTPEPAPKTPEPAKKSLFPGAKTPEPAKKTPGPAPKTPEPAKKSLFPGAKTPEPAKKTPEPAKKTPEPPKKTPEPAKKTPEPPKKTPEPPKKTPEPPKKTPEPAKKPPPPESSSEEDSSDDDSDDSSDE